MPQVASMYLNGLLGWSHWSLKNAPPAGDFHWLLLQFCPAHGRSASYGYKSLMLYMYHLDGSQNYLQKNPQLRLNVQIRAVVTMDLCSLIKMLNQHSVLYHFICEEIFRRCATSDALVQIWLYECTHFGNVLRLWNTGVRMCFAPTALQ